MDKNRINANADQSPSELLFPSIKITQEAFVLTQQYINETIRSKGVVECYMYAFRHKDDPDHVIQKIYFPYQHCSEGGVQVNDLNLRKVFIEFRKKDYILSTWIHQHCYTELRPSGPYSPPINDRNCNSNLLNTIGTTNYKTYYEKSINAMEDLLISTGPDGKLTLLGKDDSQIAITLEPKNNSALIEEFLRRTIAAIGTSIPIYYSYINCIIMNPTIPDPRLNINRRLVAGFEKLGGRIGMNIIDAFSVDKKKASVIAQEKIPANLQQDIYTDPYAGVFWRKWSHFSPSTDLLNERQVPLEMIVATDKICIDYDKIRAEVKEKVLLREVQSSEYFRMTINDLVRITNDDRSKGGS